MNTYFLVDPDLVYPIRDYDHLTWTPAYTPNNGNLKAQDLFVISQSFVRNEQT